MATTCLMCGASIVQGILCPGCDRPRRVKMPGSEAKQAAEGGAGRQAAVAQAIDVFPKAPIVPFPVENTSPAITSIAGVLVAAGVAAIVLGSDRNVKFATEQMQSLFGPWDLATLKDVERQAGVQIGDLSISSSSHLLIADHHVLFSLVPLMGGAGGAVLVFRAVDAQTAAMETQRPNLPKVTDVIRTVADRFASFADVKSIRIETDLPDDLGEQLTDHDELADALAVLVDNSLNYVPSGGQVIVGVRRMEHKEKSLLLFFVMDNGPLVPEQLRQVIFEPGFACNPASSQRTGCDLYKVRDFAVAHAGSVWVDSKSGKACTFFMRVRPDGAR